MPPFLEMIRTLQVAEDTNLQKQEKLIKRAFPGIHWTLEPECGDWIGSIPRYDETRIVFTLWKEEPCDLWRGALYCNWDSTHTVKSNIDGYAFQTDGSPDLEGAIAQYKAQFAALMPFGGYRDDSDAKDELDLLRKAIGQ